MGSTTVRFAVSSWTSVSRLDIIAFFVVIVVDGVVVDGVVVDVDAVVDGVVVDGVVVDGVVVDGVVVEGVVVEGVVFVVGAVDFLLKINFSILKQRISIFNYF